MRAWTLTRIQVYRPLFDLQLKSILECISSTERETCMEFSIFGLFLSASKGAEENMTPFSLMQSKCLKKSCFCVLVASF
jgi:hypothetical protein